jgi:membrane protein implicated in regulation of membrane protease activity
MSRRLFTVVSVALLLLALLTIVLWVRSYGGRDSAGWVLGGWTLSADSVRGEVVLMASHRASVKGARPWSWHRRDEPINEPPLGPYFALHSDFHGFVLTHDTLVLLNGNSEDRLALAAPHWALALLAILLVALPALFRRLRGRRRRKSNRCATCGYDLRATPDRCPECGTMAPNTPEASA